MSELMDFGRRAGRITLEFMCLERVIAGNQEQCEDPKRDTSDFQLLLRHSSVGFIHHVLVHLGLQMTANTNSIWVK